MEHHWHFSVENIFFIGIAAMVVRYLWLLVAAALVPSGGFLGQLGQAMGGIAH
jgi:hypothetical protein